jgi:type VI secretion system protein ImpK
MSLVTSLASYRGVSPALDRRTWNLALSFQEVFTVIMRLRSKRLEIANAESFRAQIKQTLRAAEQDAVSRGYNPEDVRRAIFVIVAFLDESILSSENRAFADWPRLPLQAELFGHQLAGEIVFQELQKILARQDSQPLADLLEVFYLCLLLGFQGRYAAGGRGDLLANMAAIKQKIECVRGAPSPLFPRGALPPDAVRLAQVDPLLPKLARTAVIAFAGAALLFLILKLVLISGASGISSLPAHLPYQVQG